MYKVIKDDKIVAVLDTDEVVGLNYDEIIEDTEHTVDDYDQYNSEFLLKSEIPAPTHEEQSKKREAAYVAEVDRLHARKMRKTILGEWTEDDEEEYLAKVKELSEEIEARYPYNEVENN